MSFRKDRDLLLRLTNLKFDYLDILEEMTHRQPPIKTGPFNRAKNALTKSVDLSGKAFKILIAFFEQEEKQSKKRR